jgi:hypothetical protein
MKATHLNFLLGFLFLGLFPACTTPVAIDPLNNPEQVADYKAGYFYATLENDAGSIFRTAINEMDELGYFRTGELHSSEAITILARKVGDQKVQVRIKQLAPEQVEIRIRIGVLGNLAESQTLYEHIKDAL